MHHVAAALCGTFQQHQVGHLRMSIGLAVRTFPEEARLRREAREENCAEAGNETCETPKKNTQLRTHSLIPHYSTILLSLVSLYALFSHSSTAIIHTPQALADAYPDTGEPHDERASCGALENGTSSTYALRIRTWRGVPIRPEC